MEKSSEQYVNFLTVDEMMALNIMAKALLELGGKLALFGELEVSDNFKVDLNSATEKLSKKIEEVKKW